MRTVPPSAMGFVVFIAAALNVHPCAVSVKALFTAPKTSVASPLVIPPAIIKCAACISWSSATVNGWLLEASVLNRATSGADWFDWQVAARLPPDRTSHVLDLERGLTYRFRLAGMSDEGAHPFGLPTAPICALGDPQLMEERPAGGDRIDAPSTKMLLQPTARPSDVAPWAGDPGIGAPPSPSPSVAVASSHICSASWGSGEQPLLSLVPTTADLALLQAQSSLVAALRAGRKRVRVECRPPGLNWPIAASHPLSEPLLGYVAIALAEALHGLRVMCIFPSEARGAHAQRAYEKISGRFPRCRLSGIAGAVTSEGMEEGVDYIPGVDPADPSDVYVFVAPTSSNDDAVDWALQRAVERAPHATFVLLNPDSAHAGARTHAAGGGWRVPPPPCAPRRSVPAVGFVSYRGAGGLGVRPADCVCVALWVL